MNGNVRPLNLTPKRLAALRYIQQNPGCLARGLIAVCDRQEVNWGEPGRTWSGFDRSGTGKQAATRWGMNYAKPLVAAGLVREEWAFPGGARYYLTPTGTRVATTGVLAP